MKIKKGIIAAVLGISLILSGCSGSSTPLNDSGEKVINEKPSFNEPVTKDSSGQLSYLSEINVVEKGLNLATLNYGTIVISPDGRYVVFSAREVSKDVSKMPESQLVLADLISGEVKKLDRGKNIEVRNWFPDSKKILYRKFDNLFVADISGNDPIKIGEHAYGGSISPDGTKVAYAEIENGISIVNVDGSNKKEVTSKIGDWYPIWYPDGKNLFYFADRGVTLSDGAGQLQGFAKVHIETGETEDILREEEKGKYRFANWIEPGKTLHINKGWDDGQSILIVNLEKGTITNLGETDVSLPDLTAIDNSNGIVYKAEDDKVIVYNSEGEEIKSFSFKKPIDDKFLINFGYSVSPDGKMLAYLFGENGFNDFSNIKGRKVYITDSDGGNIRGVFQEYGYYSQPVWTPDGTHIVTIETRNVNGETPKFLLRIIPMN